jgi:hypothetical protein
VPITPNFSITQSSGDLSSVTLTDTSTGSDGALTIRLVYFRKYDGTYLVPSGTTTDYIVWDILDATLDIADLLDKDYCLDVTVYWFTGSTATYSKTILSLFTGYGDLFLRQLTQALGANRITITATNFWVNKNKLRVLLDDAAQAVTLLNDQTIATFCLDEAKKLTDNIQTFY